MKPSAAELAAERAWITVARIRVLTEPGDVLLPGAEVVAYQAGSTGEPVDRSRWWTGVHPDDPDIALRTDQAEVLAILWDVPPAPDE